MNLPVLISTGTARSSSSRSTPDNKLRVGWQRKPIAELMMIKGVRGYSWLYWKDGAKQMMAYTMKHYVSQLPMDDFIRIHQNCLINRAFVRKTQLTHRGPLLHLITGIQITISRRQWTFVKKQIQDSSRKYNQDNELFRCVD